MALICLGVLTGSLNSSSEATTQGRRLSLLCLLMYILAVEGRRIRNNLVVTFPIRLLKQKHPVHH